MRKLLLASAAILGATGGLAYAQTPANPSQGQLAAPYAGGASYNSNNNAWGIANTPSGSAAAGGLSTYGSLGQNFYAVPAPGTVTIRLNGRVEVDMGVGSTSLNSSSQTVTTPATISTAGVITPGSTSVVRYKTNPVNIGSYMRLYPGFDGLSANGIRYGAQIELRENFQPAQSTGGTAAAPAINSPSVNTSNQTVLVRRAYSYLASDQAGLLRMGQGDGVIGLFDNCIFTSQCWDAGFGVFQNNNFGGFYPTQAFGGAAVNYPWLAQAGAEYGNNKIVYLSPQFYGFDFGIQYAPNQGNSFANASPEAGYPATVGNTTIISDTLQSITSGNTTNRWYNQVGGGIRYENVFGPVDVKAYGFYETAAHENGPHSTAVNSATNLDNISLYQGGIAITTAGLTGAVTYQGGRVNNQLALDPKGAAPMSATVAGLTYITGPITAGATVGMIDSQGSTGLVGVSQRHQFEVAVGGNYKLAPGMNLTLEYDFYQTHQGNFNFATNTAGSKAYNDVKGQALIFGTAVTW